MARSAYAQAGRSPDAKEDGLIQSNAEEGSHRCRTRLEPGHQAQGASPAAQLWQAGSDGRPERAALHIFGRSVSEGRGAQAPKPPDRREGSAPKGAERGPARFSGQAAAAIGRSLRAGGARPQNPRLHTPHGDQHNYLTKRQRGVDHPRSGDGRGAVATARPKEPGGACDDRDDRLMASERSERAIHRASR